MDINPIIVDESGAVAVDARIVIDSAPQASNGRASDYHHLSILPYPARYEKTLPLRGGGEYTIRPIHPDDAHMLKNWSANSRRRAATSGLYRAWPSCRRRCWRALP